MTNLKSVASDKIKTVSLKTDSSGKNSPYDFSCVFNQDYEFPVTSLGIEHGEDQTGTLFLDIVQDSRSIEIRIEFYKFEVLEDEIIYYTEDELN